jgi:hypothetical protein
MIWKIVLIPLAILNMACFVAECVHGDYWHALFNLVVACFLSGILIAS